ncbi:MAG: hypothetical protein GY857_12275 [Desulfobacula sp.]|nr:hypothetical protein [Desulfobacula sp.]
MDHRVTIFKPYPFQKGQKIRIEGSRRSGDWEVMDLSESEVTLQCPISKKEFKWPIFCYHVEDQIVKWPGV